MEEKKYYIVSKKHMRRKEKIFLLWRTNFSGYTDDEAEAGQYTIEEVRERYGDEFPVVECFADFYGCMKGKTGNFLIPVDKEELKMIGLRKVTVITLTK